MAETRRAANNDTGPVQYSVTVGIEDITMSHLTDAKAAVSAPDSARVQTGGYNPAVTDGNPDHPFSVTFTWVE